MDFEEITGESKHFTEWLKKYREEKLNAKGDGPYRVFYIHQNGTIEGEKVFKEKDEARVYAKKLAGAESSDISLMEWSEQKQHLEAILDMPIQCAQENLLTYLRGLGITEEEIKEKVDSYDGISRCGNVAVVKGPNGECGYLWSFAFDSKYGLHYVLVEY